MAAHIGLPSGALAAAYLRRLGISEREAANVVANRPLQPDAAGAKALLSDLLRRHIFRIPFENLDPHRLPACCGTSGDPACTMEMRTNRLRDARSLVERLVANPTVGGVGIELNIAFHWLLVQLGAKARLGLAQVASTAGAYLPQPSHCVILVDLSDAPLLVDPGFADPPRGPVELTGEAADDLWSYEVSAKEEDAAPAGFTRLLKRRGGNGGVRRSLDAEESNPDVAESVMYAFRPDDDLGSDAEEFRTGLTIALEADSSMKLIYLGLPRGHVLLGDQRMRRVEGGRVEDTNVETDEDWARLASEILASPILAPPAVEALNHSQKMPSFLLKTQSSREAAASKSQSYGTVEGKSLAVGGAGAGGGLGLNAPGFGPKVKHFAKTEASAAKAVDVDEAVGEAWAEVMHDGSSTGWVFCGYSADGKKIELTAKGEGGLSAFKENLGSAIAWGGFRCYGVDKRGGLECKRPKFIFVQYKPEAAPAMKKAKQGSHKGAVKDVIMGAHLDLVVESLEDLDEESLISKLQAATGAHKPNGYEFDEGVFRDADYYGLGIGKNCKGESSIG